MPVEAPVNPLQVSPRMQRPLDDLCFDISRLFYAYSALLPRVLESHGAGKHVQVGDGPIMFALFEKDDVIIKDLVERTSLAPSTLSRILRRMENAGLIECRRCEADGRAVRVRLTELGRSLESALKSSLAELHQTLEARMTATQLRELKLGMAMLIENIRMGI